MPKQDAVATGAVNYGQILGYLPSQGYYTIQLNFQLDSAKSYQIQYSLDGGATWVPGPPQFQVHPGASSYNTNLQVPGGLPVRIVEV